MNSCRKVYEELRKLGAVKPATEKPGQTLDATGLVHEAFLKLGTTKSVSPSIQALHSTRFSGILGAIPIEPSTPAERESWPA